MEEKNFKKLKPIMEKALFYLNPKKLKKIRSYFEDLNTVSQNIFDNGYMGKDDIEIIADIIATLQYNYGISLCSLLGDESCNLPSIGKKYPELLCSVISGPMCDNIKY